MSDGFDLGSLLKQAQALQNQLTTAQQDAATRIAEGSAGGGMVTAKVNGRLEVLEVRLDPTLLEKPDREMLQDLVVAAVNDAVRRAQRMLADEMGKLTGQLGMKLPGSE